MFNREAAARARSDQGITFASLADAAQVPVRQMFRFLSGDAEPRLTQAGRMARALGVPLDSLYIHEADATRSAESAPLNGPEPTAALPRHSAVGSR